MPWSLLLHDIYPCLESMQWSNEITEGKIPCLWQLPVAKVTQTECDVIQGLRAKKLPNENGCT